MPTMTKDAESPVSAWPGYGTPRGTCPSCGSGEVSHTIYGLPASFDNPPWVILGGCVIGGATRECDTCGYGWNPPYEDEEENEFQ